MDPNLLESLLVPAGLLCFGLKTALACFALPWYLAAYVRMLECPWSEMKTTILHQLALVVVAGKRVGDSPCMDKKFFLSGNFPAPDHLGIPVKETANDLQLQLRFYAGFHRGNGTVHRICLHASAHHGDTALLWNCTVTKMGPESSFLREEPPSEVGMRLHQMS